MTLAISPSGIDLTFYQVAPGSEPKIDADFVSNETRGLPPRKEFFKALGRFDLLVIEELLGQAKPAQPSLLLKDYVLSVHKVVAPLLDLDGQAVLWDRLEEYPLIAVSFLKFSPGVFAELGTDLIARLAHLLLDGAGGKTDRWPGRLTPHLALYGTVGYNELLAVSLTDTQQGYEPILADILRIRSFRLADIGFRGDAGVFIDTHTIPAASYGCLPRLSTLSTSNATQTEGRDSDSRRVGATISVATLAGFEEQTAAQLEASLSISTAPTEVRPEQSDQSRPADPPQVKAVLGEYDLRIRTELSLPAGLGTILALRTSSDVGPGIIATSTDLEFDRLPTLGSVSRPAIQYVEANLSDTIRQFVSRDPLLYHSLISVLGGINSRLARPDLVDAYSDLSPCIQALATDTYESGRFEAEQTRRLWKLTDLLTTGFRQRSAGVMLSPYTSADVAMGFQGSANAIARAAGAIPLDMLRRLGAQWVGFVIFGTSDTYLRYDLGIMNLPYSCLFDPFRWWGLFHEVGHELGYQRGITTRDDRIESIRAELEGHYREDSGHSTATVTELHNSMWEIYADLVDYAVGFRGDWDLYAKTLVPFLMHDARNAEYYLFRLASVWWLHRNRIQSGPHGPSSLRTVGEVVGSLFDEVNELLRGVVSEPTPMRAYLAEQLRVWLPYIEYAADDVMDVVLGQGAQHGAHTGADQVLRGVVSDDLDDPIGLLLELLRHQATARDMDEGTNHNFAIRMAAIASMDLFVLKQMRSSSVVRLRIS